MPVEGTIVIAVICILFMLAVILLFYISARYKRFSRLVRDDARNSSEFLHRVISDYAAAYKYHGAEVNTPAIISDSIASRLGGLLFCERFLNNAVSLFVTLGLFGTFLGLSLSVTSLTELISSDTSEWLSVLNSVGGGLMSALSGMGVAFYTSLVGVVCSIILTILRSIFSPSAARELLEARLELWLDQSVAPTLPTKASGDDIDLIHEMIDAMNDASYAMEKTLVDTTNSLRAALKNFDNTVNSFGGSVRDFSEFNYNLRGTVERMDLGVREFNSALKNAASRFERGEG